MLNRPQSYYFGRLNIIASYSDKYIFLSTSLNYKEELDIRNFKWGFFNIEEFSDTTGNYFTGYLAKYRPITEEEIADEDIHRILSEEAEKRISAKARFFLHIDSGLIIYHHVGRKIMRHQFVNNFCHILEMAHDNFFVRAEIQSIDEKFEILDIIKKLKRINKVTFYLHPSNPSSADVWKDLDDRFKELKVSQYHEEYIGEQGESLDIIDDDDFNSKLNMAVDGYGSASIAGELDGQKKIIRTKDNPVTATSHQGDKNHQGVFQDLRNKITEIFNRFMN